MTENSLTPEKHYEGLLKLVHNSRGLMRCPICNGLGIIQTPAEITKKDTTGSLKRTAKKLRSKGFTIREIMKAMGYKHPGSISHLLNP